MERATSNDGTTIAFDRSGQGPAIVFVGGALSDRSAAFPITAQDQGPDTDVLAPVLEGFFIG